jgi:hypothetical protein
MMTCKKQKNKEPGEREGKQEQEQKRRRAKEPSVRKGIKAPVE